MSFRTWLMAMGPGFGAFCIFASAGCGNEVTINTGGSGTTSGAKTSTGTTSPTTSTASTMTTSAIMSTGVTSTSTGGNPCGGLTEAECLGAYPSCAPLYDDHCCPTCAPTGACADCIDIRYWACYPKDSICNGAVPCGEISKETCAGAPASCPANNCAANPGCVNACKPDAAGNCINTECHSVTKGSCMSVCDGIPPNCQPGYTAEQNGSCYTGYCIEDSTCLYKSP